MEEHDLIPTKHSEVDVSRLPSLVEFSKQVRPEVVINATGYTDVDGCEANRERSRASIWITIKRFMGLR